MYSVLLITPLSKLQGSKHHEEKRLGEAVEVRCSALVFVRGPIRISVGISAIQTEVIHKAHETNGEMIVRLTRPMAR
jgi:hypothetical protein